MKLNKLWAGALALFALTACNKDIEPSTMTSGVDAPKTKEVYASLSVGQEEASLRVLYNLESDDSGATSGLAMADKDLYIRLAIKRGTGVPTYQDLLFKKVAGENRAVYEGPISVPADGNGDYQLSAVLLREDGGLTFAKPLETVNNPEYPHRVDITLTPRALVLPVANQIQANVPYLSAWQKVALDASGTKLAPTTIKFEPQGTLLRFRIKNETDQEYNIKQVNFMSTAISPLARVLFDQVSPIDPSFPLLRPGHYYPPYVYTLPTTHQTIAAKSGNQPGKSPWYYIWVMPTEFYHVRTQVNLVTTSGAKIDNVFSTDQPLPFGSVPVTFTIRNSGHTGLFEDIGEVPNEWGSIYKPKLALDYVAEYDFDNNDVNRGFVENHDFSPANLGLFTWEDAVAKFYTPVVIQGKKYSLPTAAEMHSIFPARFYYRSEGEVDGAFIGATHPINNQLEKEIKIGSLTKSYYADYRNGSTRRTTYAVRFKDKTNLNRTAFWYELNNISATEYRLVVTCRYLGNTSVGIDDVAKPAFWQTNTGGDVSRTFVLRGYQDYNPYYTDVRSTTLWWTSNAPDRYTGTSLVIDSTFGYLRYDHKLNRGLVRPWIRD